MAAQVSVFLVLWPGPDLPLHDAEEGRTWHHVIAPVLCSAWWHSKAKNLGYKDCSMNEATMGTYSFWPKYLAIVKGGCYDSLCRLSCQFDARWVTRGHFNCQTSSTLSKTMPIHCTNHNFVHRVVPCIHTPWPWSVI